MSFERAVTACARKRSRGDGRNMARLKTILLVTLGCALLAPAVPLRAVEVLPARELAGHCQAYPENQASKSAQFCVHYVQGFIDGAVSTDVRVMMNMEAEYQRPETLTERAIRTRMPGAHEQGRAARYAGFCLGDPIPLREVVAKVAAELRDQAATMDAALPAREAVYQTLRTTYPC